MPLGGGSPTTLAGGLTNSVGIAVDSVRGTERSWPGFLGVVHSIAWMGLVCTLFCDTLSGNPCDRKDVAT